MTPQEGTYSWISSFFGLDGGIAISSDNLVDAGDYTINLRASFTGDYTFTEDTGQVNTLSLNTEDIVLSISMVNPCREITSSVINDINFYNELQSELSISFDQFTVPAYAVCGDFEYTASS